MSQLNEQDPSNIDDLFLTSDGTETGIPVRAVWKEADWSPLKRTARPVIGGAETQQVDFGGDDGTENWPATIEIENCTDVLYAGLKAKRNTSATTFPALFKLEATDAAGAKTQQAFEALRFLDLHYDTSARFGSRTYEKVVATLISEA